MAKFVSRVGAVLCLGMAAAGAVPPIFQGGGLIRTERRAPVLRPLSGAEPWLGVSVQKPGKRLAAKFERVPEGVGFLVHKVTNGGPADDAGVKQGDLLLKLDDQFLVNEAQFLVLLHLHKVGEKVKLTIRRESNDRELQVLLRERPTSETGRKEADVAVLTGPPVSGLPDQVTDILRQVASVGDEHGVTVRLERKGDLFHWRQFDAAGAVIQEGDVTGMEDIRFRPGTNEDLARKLRALIRAYKDVEKRAASGGRRPRVRRVPPNPVNKVPNPR